MATTVINATSDDMNDTTTSMGEVPVIPMKPAIPVDLGVGLGTLEGVDLHIAVGIEAVLEIFIVFGNILVIVSIIGYQSLRRTKTNRYLLSLAISDLLVGLVIPIGLVSKYFPDFFFRSVQICVMPFCLMITLCCASIFNLMALSFDRYVAITNPLKYPLLMTSSRSNAIIACAWSGAILVGTTPLYWHEEAYYWGDTGELFLCTWDTIITDLYIIGFANIGLLLPIVVILILYSKIFKIAVNHSRMRDQRQQMFDEAIGKHRPSKPTIEGQPKTKYSIENNDSCPPVDSARKSISNEKEDSPEKRFERKSSNLSNQTFCNETYTGGLTTVDNESRQKGDRGSSTKSSTGSRRKGSKLKRSLSINEVKPSSQAENTNSDIERKRKMMAPKKSLSANRLSRLLRRNSSSMTREKRTSVTISIVVLAFVVCWLPFMIIMLLECLCPNQCGVTPSIRVWFGILGYANSGVNPVIYSLRTEDFRKAIKHMFRKCGCCKEKNKEIPLQPQMVNSSKRTISSIKETPNITGKEISSSQLPSPRTTTAASETIAEDCSKLDDSRGPASSKEPLPIFCIC
ncbi:alpha-2A adrenergic receptor-like [Antedon mediterranea]|uniref:alpha-2A adrenergic receptor-like n=1 Tax=Antedon mediterranea TaxID=105859 RepID=UPI003AF5809D